MNTVQDTSSASSLFGAAAADAKKSAGQETQDRFLSLLIAQMKNQDPLNPMDNAQVTSQMAQLSTVQGIEKMNSSLAALASSLGSNQLTQAANLIGRGVLVPGNSLSPAEYENFIGFDLDRPADNVKVGIYDTYNRLVRSLDFGARETGVNMMTWDGMTDAGTQAAAGKYQFKIEAIQGGKPVGATPLNLEMVNSVSQGTQGVLLNLTGNESVGYADIRQVF